jgi:H+/Cl- antiporter ClcA
MLIIIGGIFGLYITTRMLQIFFREDEKQEHWLTKIFSGITIAAILYFFYRLWVFNQQSMQATNDLESIFSNLRNLLNL